MKDNQTSSHSYVPEIGIRYRLLSITAASFAK
jgi:hypothetical protein